MTTEAAFRQDICDHPDDDVPRLIYADWLSDRGRPDDAERADFIRVQCQLARLQADDSALRALERHEGELLAPRLARWWNELPTWARQDTVLGPERSFQRGFIYAVAANVEAFLSHGAALVQRFPVQRAHLTGTRSGPVQALAACPHLAHIKWLGLSGPISPAAVEALASSPHLARLISLDLSGCRLGDAAAQAIAGPASAPCLWELFLDVSGLTDAGAATLANSPGLAGLTVLSLGGNHISEAGARSLATGPHLARLAYLDLTGNPIGAQGREFLRQRFGTAVLLPR